ncbi:MAG: twin-arginine translocase TatA/TatE family subunit [Myxococcales bacterium]|nr:twin-arginine translocase TatA/TatE family subunit [Myxococcales bacterium]
MLATAPRGVPLFDLSIGELLVIAVLILVFVGPDRIPELMSVAGRYYGKFRRMSDDLRRTFNAEVARHESDRRREELESRRKEIESRRREERDRAERTANATDAAGEEPATAEVPEAEAPERPVPVDAVARLKAHAAPPPDDGDA